MSPVNLFRFCNDSSTIKIIIEGHAGPIRDAYSINATMFIKLSFQIFNASMKGTNISDSSNESFCWSLNLSYTT